MANWTKERWQEIANRGLQDKLSPERKARFDEIVRRGLITIDKPVTGVDPDVPTAENLALSRQAKPTPEEKSLGDYILGGGEAALTAITSATGGTIGGVIGNLEGALQYAMGRATPEQAQEIAARYSGALTYQPKTEVGQDIIEGAGELTEALPPVLGVTPPAQIVAGAQSFRGTPKPQMPSLKANENNNSVGAMQTSQESIRQQRAESLPVPIKLTKGQKEQDLSQQKFERETAKSEVGGDLRDRYTEQNAKLNQNIDAFIDETGTVLPDEQSKIGTGQAVDKALRARAAKDKAEIRAAYKDAEKSPEANELVDISQVSDYMNENMAGASSAPIMGQFQKETQRLGLSDGDVNNGNFLLSDMTLKQSEDLRKFVNRFTDENNSNDVRVASDIKRLIDASTESSGGEKYKKARRLRSRYASNYENIGIVKDLLGKKRGTDDRKIALENVSNKIINGTVEDLKQVRRLLRTQGEEGESAFNEIRAQALKDLKESVTKNVGSDQQGNPIISAAAFDKYVKNLDQNGKLDLLFGKKGAEQIRDLRDISKDVLVSQPGAVNYSNTASSIAAALDIITSGFAGLPLPIAIGTRKASKAISERKTKQRIKQALE